MIKNKMKVLNIEMGILRANYGQPGDFPVNCRQLNCNGRCSWHQL